MSLVIIKDYIMKLTPFVGSWTDTVQVAKNVRIMLKSKFPSTKFSVRVRDGAIWVKWTDAESIAEVKKDIDIFDGTDEVFAKNFGFAEYILYERES